MSPGALLEQRIYHLTHRSNLPSIFADGALKAGSTPELELSPLEARVERGEIEFAGSGDRRLRDYVPFFLSPETELWRELRAGRAHPRLSSAARAADVFDFVFLVSTIGRVLAAESAFALTDGNAEGNATRFASTREDAERMLYRLRASELESARHNAEFLVAESLPLESITLIGVANDRARQGVRDQLAESGFAPKISVYPPWFQQTE